MKRFSIMFVVAIMFTVFAVAQAGDTPATASDKSAPAGCTGHKTAADCARLCGMKAEQGAKMSAMSPEECAKLCGMTPEQCAKMCAGKENCGVAHISVKGMTCGSCEKTVSAALSGIDGVYKVINVDHKEGMAVVCFDPTQVKDADMAAVIINSGYKAEIIPAVARTGAKTGVTMVSASGHNCGPEAAKMCGASKKGCGASKTSGCGGSKVTTISGGKAPE